MANVITSVRIVLALALIFCPMFSGAFYVVYILGGISDVFDGIVARRFDKETKFGSQFDTSADVVFSIIVIIKVVKIIHIPLWLIIWIICISAIKIFNFILSIASYKSIIPEHTVMNKVCGILLFVIPIFIGFLPCNVYKLLIIATCVVSTLAAIQEGYYIRIGKEIH